MEPPERISTTPYVISIGRADIFTTELGLAAFDGEVDMVRERLRAGVDWEREGSKLLEGAILGQHIDLAREILAAGSPISDDAYGCAFHHCLPCLDLLPERKDLIRPMQIGKDWSALNWAIVRREADTVSEILGRSKFSLDRTVLLTYGMGDLAPIHYAIRSGSPRMVRLVVEYGADVNFALTDGRSPLRAVYDDEQISKQDRKEIMTYLRSAGARATPPIPPTLWTKIRTLFGGRGSE